jgi:photosystem I P700 chlorophyll a apoprotein A2
VVQANRNTFIGRCATNKYFQIIGSIHDIESYSPIDHTSSYDVQIFLCHWGHLAIIFVWVSRNLFHIGWNGNYELWEQNPIDTLPIADGIWDPHFGLSKSSQHMNIAYNGIRNYSHSGLDIIHLLVSNSFQLRSARGKGRYVME